MAVGLCWLLALNSMFLGCRGVNLLNTCSRPSNVNAKGHCYQGIKYLTVLIVHPLFLFVYLFILYKMNLPWIF